MSRDALFVDHPMTVDAVRRPLTELLRGMSASRADVVVAGARGVGAVERLLLGNVAEGALAHAPVSVLIVK
jgi:nucleotide-binding universal stress UspA family protein